MQSVRQCGCMTGKGAGYRKRGNGMGAGAYAIDVISAVIAVEYIDYGLFFDNYHTEQAD